MRVAKCARLRRRALGEENDDDDDDDEAEDIRVMVGS